MKRINAKSLNHRKNDKVFIWWILNMIIKSFFEWFVEFYVRYLVYENTKCNKRVVNIWFR